jgi:excisionase family DNA binding protein
MEDRDLLTVDEAAAALGVSAHAIRKRLLRGLMRGESIGSGRRRLWLIPRAEVERWRGVGQLKRGPKPRPRGPESQENSI